MNLKFKMPSALSALNQGSAALNQRPARERWLVFGAIAAIGIWALSQGVTSFDGGFAAGEERFVARARELSTLRDELTRYRKLAARAEEIEKLYAKSEISVEQVYTEVEKVVRDSIGGDGYELRPVGSVVEVSPTVEQQGFSLRVRSATLEQVVGLLHRLEQGKAPLFLAKVEVAKSTQPGTYSLGVELSSLRKKRSA